MCVIKSDCVTPVCPLCLRIDGMFYTLSRIMYMWLLVSYPSSNAAVCLRVCVCVRACVCARARFPLDLSYPGQDGGVLPNSV